MIPTNVIMDALANLLAADPNTLAPVANAVKVHLIKAPFTPGPTADFTTMTEATFGSYAAKQAGLGAQQEFVDPATGMRTIQLLEPAGGWHWRASNGTDLPQTIYGYAVTDNASAVTYGTGLLPTPILLSAPNQGIDLPNVRFALLNGALV